MPIGVQLQLQLQWAGGRGATSSPSPPPSSPSLTWNWGGGGMRGSRYVVESGESLLPFGVWVVQRQTNGTRATLLQLECEDKVARTWPLAVELLPCPGRTWRSAVASRAAMSSSVQTLSAPYSRQTWRKASELMRTIGARTTYPGSHHRQIRQRGGWVTVGCVGSCVGSASATLAFSDGPGRRRS